MAAWGYEFYLLVLKLSLTSFRFGHSWEILSAREDKIRIPKRLCNILYLEKRQKGMQYLLSSLESIQSTVTQLNLSENARRPRGKFRTE